MIPRLLALIVLPVTVLPGAEPIEFPSERPERWSYARPRDGAVLEISPPGFCWWRAAPRGEVQYRLRVLDGEGRKAYESALLDDPVCVPDRVLEPGRYSWSVDAVAPDGRVADTWPARSFEIAESAVAQPWIPAEELLARVPRDRPRLLFPKATLEDVRATLKTSRREAYESLTRSAARALAMAVPDEPDYDEIDDPAQRRLAYFESFHEMREIHLGGMLPAALMYQLSGEREYGEKARELLLGAARWDPEGISSVQAPYGDEVGLGLAKSGAQTYDWIHGLLSEPDRRKVEDMLVARADQMLRRLERLDFLNRPESSHDGRLPGYLIEHAIALAEHPRARVWMDYALRAVRTVFPHWAGRDGGWAEGLAYATGYNTIFITPFESLRRATGLDLWQRPFYRRLPYFFVYNVSPLGEIMGFGDSYDGDVRGRAASIRGLLQLHAERTRDATLAGWIDLLRDERGSRPALPALPGLIFPREVSPVSPAELPPDAVFRGVGWAALHTDLASPEEDLLVAFKSSPFGGVSHSYADQNGFAILKGGRALARPGGSRYPQHGTPFHTRYTQQTIAQSSILVDGRGQIPRSGAANAKITAFESRPAFGYVCGDATAAYGDRLARFQRHVLLVRPYLVCIVDDLEAPAPADFQWLMHAPERLQLDETSQTFTSRRGGASMDVQLATPGGFALSQTDEWPLPPKTGFPTATRPEPARLWHLTASTREKAAARRIAAVLVVRGPGEEPDCRVVADDESVRVTARLPEGEATVRIDLSTEETGRPLLKLACRSESGSGETFAVAP